MAFGLSELFGIFLIFIFLGISLAASIGTFQFYSHKNEYQIKFAKQLTVFIIVGMTLDLLFLFMIPIDMLSTYKHRQMQTGFDFNLKYFWQIFTFTFIISSLVCLIFNFFYKFQTAQNQKLSQKKSIIKLSTILFSYGFLVVSVYFGCRTVDYRVQIQPINISTLQRSDETKKYEFKDKQNDYQKELVFKLPITFFNSLLIPFVIIGSIFFGICGGAGLAFFPFDLMFSYIYQPRPPNPENHVIARKILVDQTIVLYEKSKSIQLLLINMRESKKEAQYPLKSDKKKYKKQLFELKTDFLHFQDMYDYFKLEENIVEVNPLKFLVDLILGIIFILFNTIIILGTFTYIIGTQTQFSIVLLKIHQKHAIISIILFTLLAIYYSLSTIKGAIKVMFLTRKYLNSNPVRAHRTYLNSFFSQIIYANLGIVGFTIYISKVMPDITRSTFFDNFYNRILSRTSYLHSIYKLKIIEVIFILSFIVGFVISFFQYNGYAQLKKLTREKIKDMNDKMDRMRTTEFKDVIREQLNK